MTDIKQSTGNDPETIETVSFEFIKSQFFRVIHADGMFGGPSTANSLDIAIYSERRAIPQRVTHSISPNGTLGAEITKERVIKDSLIREVETNLVMDYETAKSFRNWLDDKIQVMESYRKSE